MGCAGSSQAATVDANLKVAGEATAKAADDVKKTVDQASKEAKKGVDDVQKDVKQTAAEATKAVDDVQKTVDDVQKEVKKAADEGAKTVDEGKKEVTSEVTKAADEGAKAVDEATKEATAEVQKAADEVKQVVTAAVTAAAAIVAPVKVYGMALSTCTRRVLMTLEEKQVPYELVNVDLMKGEHKLPDFLEIQPFGQIPVLVDGDVTIFESRSIARYIATKWAGQGTDLLGKDVSQQALTDTWLEVESNHYNGPVSTLVAEKVFKAWKSEAADEAVVAAKVEELNKVLDVYEQHLSKSAYLTGPEFSLADLSHLSYTHYLVHGAKITEPLDKHPAVKAWWEKISSRPAWVKLTAQ